MSFYFPPWDNNLEPSQGSVRQYLDNLYAKFQPIEQARWNQSNIDTLFYAGEQRFINSYFNFYPQYNWQNFHFNIIQQPINMVTGYQRQHRKSISFIPSGTNDSLTTDQQTKIIHKAHQYKGIDEKFSRACEEATVQGLVLIQPYLDYKDDPVNGTLDLKVWSYNSFLVDPYFREPDMSDANFVWCQQYISKQEAENLFPDQKNRIVPMAGTPQRYGSFYFLPENYNMARNDLMVLSYVWYKWKKKVRKLFNQQTEEIFDFSGNDPELQEVLYELPMMEEVEIEIPYWKQAVILNDQLMFQDFNPLGFSSCPFIPVYWNYDPQIAYYDLRVRSLTRACRDAQYLFNRRIILNHDISESSINSGYKYKEDSVANPENLRYAGQGKDIIIKSGFEMTDFEKIIPNAVPPSDIQLAEQLHQLMFETTGVNLENFGLGDAADKVQSGLALMMKQGAGLMVLQKYFDQWDSSLKILGDKELQIIQNNWSTSKIRNMLGEEVSPSFFSKIFYKYHVTVAEGLNTPVQQMAQFRQWLEIDQVLGGIIPKKLLLENANFLPGHDKIMRAVEEQEQQQTAMQQQSQMLEQSILDAKLKELYSKIASNIAMARERHGRAESNIGLFEERLSEISQNRSMATKNKVESLEKLLDLISKYGEIEAALKAAELQSVNHQQEIEENREKMDAKQTSIANEFFNSIIGNSTIDGQLREPSQNF